MKLRSDLALRVYEQVFWGIDKPLGYTMGRDAFEVQPVVIPEHISWYVRHPDREFLDPFLVELTAEVIAKGITGLSLASCRQLSVEAFEPLRTLKDLKILDLFNTLMTDDGMAAIQECSAIRSLNLAGTGIGDRALDIIAALPHLEKLHLGWTSISDDGLRRLTKMPTLRALDIRGTQVTARGLTHLTQLSGLEALGLQETPIDDSGVAELAPLAPRMKHLYLGYTKVTEKSVPILEQFTQLRTLMLRATRVGAACDEALTNRLTQLGGPGTGEQGVQEGLIR